MVNGQRGLERGRSVYIKLWLRLNFMIKGAKCGWNKFFHIAASKKDEPCVQVTLMMLYFRIQKQDVLNYSLAFPSPSSPNFDSVNHDLCQHLELNSGSVFEFGLLPSHLLRASACLLPKSVQALRQRWINRVRFYVNFWKKQRGTVDSYPEMSLTTNYDF